MNVEGKTCHPRPAHTHIIITLYLPINPGESRARRSWEEAKTTIAGKCQMAERRWLTSEKPDATQFLGGRAH